MTDQFSIEGTGLAVPGDALGRIVARIATWKADDLHSAGQATADVSLTAASDITAAMTMVCVKPRVEEAELIADPDGDPPDILHATLAFLGEVDGDLGHIIEALGPVAASHGPLSGVVGGYGVFSPPGCGILLPDVPGLAELRQAVAEALHGAGIDFGRDHGWTPHITVDQDPEPEELEEMLDRAAGAPLHFEELLIVRGNTEVVPLRLTGTTPPTAVLTAAGERFCLPSELRLRTDPVYQEFVRTVMRPVLENAGMSFSTSNPLASQLLSQAGSQIVGISQTTQDDVVKVITDAHEQGLSIPDTAKAIREHMDGAANTRATMIARTELSRAANGSALAATKSVSEALGGIPSKTWMTAQGALHPRHEDYPDLDGQTVALDDYFDVGGSQMQYPSDPDGDPAESINCFPGATLVVADNARVGLRRWYRGSLVTVKTDGDHTLAGTPNHPILTNAGWKPLHLIREGDYLVCGSFREEVAITRPDVEHAPTTIKQIVSALAGHNGARRIAGGAMQFHGDGSEGEIEVVTSDRDLGVSLDASLAKPLSEKTLIGANEVSSLATTACAAGQLILARRSATSRDIRSRSEALAIRQVSGGHTNEHRGRSVPGLDTEFRKTEPDYGSANPIVIGQRLLGDAFEVSLAKVVKIDEHAFHGEVFNLETESGAYLANGIIAHNCRCSLSFSGDVGDVSGMDNIDAAAPPHPVRQHNAIVKKAYKRVDELEPRLVAVLEPILRRAGEIAAANFDALVTDHLTAAGEWTPPSGEEILPVNCSAPGLPTSAIETAASDVRSVAENMIEQAAAAKPATTAELKGIAKDAGGKMTGLDHAVKTADSLARKIQADLAEALDADKTATLAETASSVNDTLRYTMTFDSPDYSQGVERAIKQLKDAGYEQVKLKNYWGNSDYQGINAVFRAPDGTRFELQFHTPQSFKLKGALRAPYEELRVSQTYEEKSRLWNEMAAEQAKLQVPSGAETIGEPVRHFGPTFHADIGVTPFRAGEDNVIGFYDSQKYAAFLNDVQTTADTYGVQIDGIDRVTGIWQSETEPSVSLRAHDGEAGMRAFAANLGQAYNQDGVLIFSDASTGDVMATFDKTLSKSQATEMMSKVGIDGGRFTTDGRLQIIGSGPEFVAQLDKLASESGSRYQYAVGRFELLNRDTGEYGKALDQFAATRAEQAGEPFIAQLSSDELQAVADYTGTGSMGQGYSQINGYLRGQLRARGAALQQIKDVTAALDMAIERATPLDREMTVYRAYANPMPVSVGTVLEDRGFMSTSATRSLPESWAGTHGDVWSITLPVGTRGLDLSASSITSLGQSAVATEQEILLPRGMRLVVDKVTERVTTYPATGNKVVAHDIEAHVELT